MKRFVSLMLLACGAGLQASAQPVELRSAELDWGNFRLTIAPDSEGTLLWAFAGESGKPGARAFSGTFHPTTLASWVPEARAFLKLQLAAADPGDSRSSTPLKTTEGRLLYLFRHRVQGEWSPERFLVMQPSDTTQPLSVSGTDESIGEMLDSLEAVAKRTPIWVHADSAPKFDKHARGKRTNKPPTYPPGPLNRRQNGRVILAFFVGVDGKADLSNVVVIHSTGKDFTEAVLRQLPGYSFEPAIRNGAPVRERVTMPFEFAVYQGRPR